MAISTNRLSGRLVKASCAAYWRWNRRFLLALAEALVDDRGPERSHTPALVVARIEEFLGDLPLATYLHFIGVVLAFPLYSWRVHRSRLLNLALVLLAIVTGPALRVVFVSCSLERRKRWLAGLVAALSAQPLPAGRSPVHALALFRMFKGVIGAAYMELSATWHQIGYDPRPPDADAAPVTRLDPELKGDMTLAQLAMLPPESIAWCVIGSGAGGAVAAHALQAAHPRARIVVLEAGPLVFNDQYSERLLPTVASLYVDAGYVLSEDQRFVFRQGRGVGGSTAVNNGVVVNPQGFWWDECIVKTWKNAGAHLDYTRFRKHVDDLDRLLNATPVEEHLITPAAKIVRPSLELEGFPVETMRLAVEDCTGCGGCNLGCAYGSKLSANRTLLPEFVRAGGTLITDAEVLKLVCEPGESGKKRVAQIVVRDAEGQQHVLTPQRTILACGAFASSRLLFESGLHKDGAPIGQGITTNLGSPVVGTFADPIDAWRGQQMSYFIRDPVQRSLLDVVWIPPAVYGMLATQPRISSAIHDYARSVCVVPVLGTAARGRIRPGGAAEDRYVIEYTLVPSDWARLSKMMTRAARVLLRAGAERVYDTRLSGRSISNIADIEDYYAELQDKHVHVESAHVQGGNVIHDDPKRGVVDRELRVHGLENLWICDASVIPAATTVNVQLLIMALARYAVDTIIRSDAAKPKKRRRARAAKAGAL